MNPGAGPFGALRQQLRDAAAAFADGAGVLAEILSGMVDDVDRALREELEIFPVCHHSPASALAMALRLRAKRPKVIYLELCEDLRPLLGELRNCRLPVALQAFASELHGFPKDWGPLSVVAPITEASAEYQAIAYALDTPGVEAHLLHHGKVRHWSEWWDQYVEQPLVGADYDTYRQVMVLIGSLFRRLGSDDPERLARDEDRERCMWTRMHQHLAASGVDRSQCLYVCGAFHAASRVEQFGSAATTKSCDFSPRTATRWLYGLIPSSHSAIRGPVRARLRLGVDRGGHLGQGGGPSRRHALPARGPEGPEGRRQAAGAHAGGASADGGHPARAGAGRRPAVRLPAEPAAAGRPRRGRVAGVVRRHRPAGPP
jgi:hypothetical protein